MLKANRNAPCPCGSGKKYKSCCMRRDQIATSREASLNVSDAALLSALYEFAQQPRYQGEIAHAIEVYWGGRFDLREITADDADDMRRTLEWFVHDWRVGEDRRHLIDLFIESEAKDYAAEALDILRAWASSAMGLLRVEGRSVGRLRAYDLLTDAWLDVADASLARSAREGDLLAGRIFELNGETRLSLMTMLLPPQYEQALAAYVRNAFALYRDEHPSATWDSFRRQNGHLVNAFLTSSREEPLRVYLGPGTRYHDPARLRDRLRDHTRQSEEAARRDLEAERTQQRSLPRTASGLILPGALSREAEEQQAKETPRPRILIPGRDI
jgi:hypothetical protein